MSQSFTGGGLLSPSSPRSDTKVRGPTRRRRQSTLHQTVAHHHAPNVKPPAVDSHNYEPDESEVWRSHSASKQSLDRGQWWTSSKQRAMKRWILTLVIGIIQGLVAYACNLATRWLSKIKFDHVYELLQEERVGETWAGKSYFVFLFYQTFFVAIASAFAWFEPMAIGSGIPEVKCFLNGIALPRIVRLKTLICKVLGVTFSVAAGLPVGKEGPMVHSGAVVAAGISQGKSRIFHYDTSFSKTEEFRNDREKRDFVACGAAAGVCSAFSAPIGGVLFALEEGATHWNTFLTWRTFV